MPIGIFLFSFWEKILGQSSFELSTPKTHDTEARYGFPPVGCIF